MSCVVFPDSMLRLAKPLRLFPSTLAIRCVIPLRQFSSPPQHAPKRPAPPKPPVKKPQQPQNRPVPSPQPQQPKDIINEAIQGEQFRVKDQDGKQLGVMSRAEAFALARKAEMDLLQVAAPPNAPTVCVMVNYSKYRVERSRKEAKEDLEARRKRMKSAQVSSRIADGDIKWKMEKVRQNIEKGLQVKVNMELQRRAHMNLHTPEALFEKLHAEIKDVARVVQSSNKPPTPFVIFGPIGAKDKEKDKGKSKDSASAKPAVTTAPAAAATPSKPKAASVS